jgi:hypothetical protein
MDKLLAPFRWMFQDKGRYMALAAVLYVVADVIAKKADWTALIPVMVAALSQWSKKPVPPVDVNVAAETLKKEGA